MSQDNLFHAGELAVQQRAGESQMARMNGRALSDQIPTGAIPFLAQQPMAILSSIAADGAVWASVLVGEPGFLRADDARAVTMDAASPLAVADDPLWANLQHGSSVGLLVIELSTRRRLRVNGRAKVEDGGRLGIDVDVAYPNCPKYIQRRHWSRSASSVHPLTASESRRGKLLDSRQRAWITSADTFFVASAHPQKGADASHRGGFRGFVQLVDGNTLRIPDYSGNSLFNTLGNFEAYPHAGLAFIDFEQGRLLQLTGRPTIRWDLDDPQQFAGGTGRFWDFEVACWRESVLPIAFDWEFIDFSPFNPAPADDDDYLALQVVEIKQETDQIKRFRLRAFDDADLPVFRAGAHLSVSLPVDERETLQRHYSILSDPAERSYYDIAVLREPNSRGGSRYLHESLSPGDQLVVGAPKNDFPMQRLADHSILIAGGIGITPIFGMLRQLVRDGASFELHYSAKHTRELAFRDEIEVLAGDLAFFYETREANGARMPLGDLLAAPEPGKHVYVCGPRRLIAAVRAAAREKGWSDAQIHFESFGVSVSSDDHAMTVELARTGRSIAVSANQTILDALLDAGVEVSHQCKRGECGLCTTTFLRGEPEHRDLCLTSAEQKQSLCVCVSRSKTELLELDL